jgi:ubiquitin carboxyl-terminal hydrolase L5
LASGDTACELLSVLLDSSGWQNQIRVSSRESTHFSAHNPFLLTDLTHRELLKTLGLPLIVDDIYTLDSDSAALASLYPIDIHTLIFLVKYINPSSAPQTAPNANAGYLDPGFPGFCTHETVNSACATLGVFNALWQLPSLYVSFVDSKSILFGMFGFSFRFLVLSRPAFLSEQHG